MSTLEPLNSQFNAIEHKIERLVEISRSLQASNLELQQQIKQLKEELHQKSESVKRHDEEKAFIRSRIDNLLAKLEDVPRL